MDQVYSIENLKKYFWVYFLAAVQVVINYTLHPLVLYLEHLLYHIDIWSQPDLIGTWGEIDKNTWGDWQDTEPANTEPPETEPANIGDWGWEQNNGWNHIS